MDPKRASQQSASTLSSIKFFLFLTLNVRTYLCKSIFLAISKQVFLLTNEANFLSKIPSLSLGSVSYTHLTLPTKA